MGFDNLEKSHGIMTVICSSITTTADENVTHAETTYTDVVN